MSDLSSAARLLLTGARVAWRRHRRGPQRAGWTWAAETSSMFMKAEFDRTRHLDLQALRSHVDSMTLPSLPPHRLAPEPGRLAGIPCVRFSPRGAPVDRQILYLHGGGYVFGSARSHRAFISHLASRARIVTHVPEYRLAPEHPFPAAIQDAVAAYRALLDQGADPSRLVVAGESAGGGLTAALLLRLRDDGVPLPRAAALVSPWVDHTFENDSIARNEPDDFADRQLAERWSAAYLAGADPRDPLASPVFADLQGLPPLFVQYGRAEMLLDEIRVFVARARDAGVDVTADEWDDMFHVWQFAAPVIPQAGQAVARLAAWIRDRFV